MIYKGSVQVTVAHHRDDEQLGIVVDDMTMEEVMKLHEGSEDKAFRRALRIKTAMIYITGQYELDRKYKLESVLLEYGKLKFSSMTTCSAFVKALSDKAEGVVILWYGKGRCGCFHPTVMIY